MGTYNYGDTILNYVYNGGGPKGGTLSTNFSEFYIFFNRSDLLSSLLNKKVASLFNEITSVVFRSPSGHASSDISSSVAS